MSILSGFIKAALKPIIERRVQNEIKMCGGNNFDFQSRKIRKKRKRWDTDTDSEVRYARDVGGRKRGGSARTGEAEELHRISD